MSSARSSALDKSGRKAYSLTPEQLALQAERKAAKAAKLAAVEAGEAPEAEVVDDARVLQRPWISVAGAEAATGRRIKIMLAQTLVRRDLFPGSDCLRWGDRKAHLAAELRTHAVADVICLQECDRLADLAAALPAHAAAEAKGPGKMHGLVVLYRRARFGVKAQRPVQLDLECLGKSEDERQARAGTRVTKNMALIVALEDKEGGGVIVATTHLFWHPKFAYERARQVVVLLRAIRKLQAEQGCEDWSVVLSGDLNTQPSEATYQLLAAPHRPPHPAMLAEIESSRFVHTSLDKLYETSALDAVDDGEGEGEGGASTSATATGSATPAEGEEPPPERAVKNTRDPVPADGLLSAERLLSEAAKVLPTGAISAYGSANAGDETFAARGGFGDAMGEGEKEPAYTCYTSLFKLTLDYLFVIGSAKVVGLLQPAKSEDLGEGLPRKGVCASDHLAIGCELVL
ncbi:RNA exonuclease ngl2 [Cryptotrichosporon argae]